MRTLDWQVLVAAFVAISLQIMISIIQMFGRSAIKKCSIWRETGHSRVRPLNACSDAS
jgi:hypothetical protein